MASAGSKSRRRIGRGGACRLVAHVLLVTVTASSCGGSAPPADARGSHQSDAISRSAQAGASSPNQATGLPTTQITKAVEDSYRELLRVLRQPQSPGRVSPAEKGERLEQLFAYLENDQRRRPKESFDVVALAGKIGPDATRLFNWVRDETDFVPYRGVLRGGTGVLLDRTGNSVDRALLLHSLLQRAGHEARLVRGVLSREQARDVLTAAKARPVRSRNRPPDRASVAEDLIAKFAGLYQADAAALTAQFKRLESEQQQAVQLLRQRAADQSASIEGALKRPSQSADETRQIEATRDHWWVQRRNESSWEDMDPTAGSVPGRALTAAVEGSQASKLEDLPQELNHLVRVRIVVEQWVAGGLKEHEVLAHDLRPSQLYGARVILSHQPTKWPQTGDASLLAKTILEQREWVPVLTVGSDVVSQSGFTAAGDVTATPFAPLVGSAAQGLGRGIGGLLGGGLGGGARPNQPAAASELTAEWIEYHIVAPGQPNRTIRRQLFDLVGAARRSQSVPALQITEDQRKQRAAMILGETEMLLLPSELTPAFVEHLVIERFLSNRHVLLQMARNPDGGKPEQFGEIVGRLVPLPGVLHSLAVARHAWSTFADDIYLDAPAILSSHVQFRVDPQGGSRLVSGLDIVANDVAIRPTSKANPSQVRLEQGVLDTNIEALIARATCGDLATACQGPDNTAEMFAASPPQGIAWLPVRSRTDDALRRAALPDDVRAQVEREISAGYWALVPSKPVTVQNLSVVGWWRVNPITGETLGIGQNTWGQGSVEYTLKIGFSAMCVCLVGQMWAAEGRTLQERSDNVTFRNAVGCALIGFSGAAGVAYHGAMTTGATVLVFLGAFATALN